MSASNLIDPATGQLYTTYGGIITVNFFHIIFNYIY